MISATLRDSKAAVESHTGIPGILSTPMASHTETLSRQWLMLQCIPRYPHKVTARELVERLRDEGHLVTKRTVERDLTALSQVFPLASDERNKPFGWSWQKDAVQFSLPGMSPLQAMVLNLARTHMQPLLPAHLLAALRPYFQQTDAVLKTALGAAGLKAWNQRVAVVQPTQPLLPPKVNDKVLSAVHEAIAGQHQVELRYRSRSAQRTARYRVNPLGLVYRGIIGYLVGSIEDYDDVRLLALHRIESAKTLEETARVPEGFNLQEYAHSAELGFMDNGPMKLVLRMEAPAAEHLYETPLSDDQVISEDQREGWVRITATVHDTSQLRWWLMGFGSQAEVLLPVAVREQFKAEYASSAYQ